MDSFIADSDWENSSDSGSSEHEEQLSYGGRAQNIFSSLEETIGKIDEFLSFERGFMYGDIVCSITEPLGQTGRVVNVNMFVDLESVHGRIIKEVNTTKLQRLRSFSVGDYVINGAWIGRVEKIIDRVLVILDDGSKCDVIVSDQEKLVAISPNLLEDSQYSYYPGQRVQLKLTHVPKSAKWICGNRQEIRDVGTVCAVEAGFIYVDWVGSVVMGADLSLPAPPALQDSKNLTLLSCFSHASWQLGDCCVLPTSSSKDIPEQKAPHAASYSLLREHRKLERGFQRHTQCSSLDELFVIIKTKMKVDVMWQDGSCSLGVDSQQVLPVAAVNAHDFWPEQFVVEKEMCDGQRWGIVRAVDAKEQTVKVQWITRVEKEASSFAEEQKEEIVSAYELLEHPDYGFFFNDVVFRVPSEGNGHGNADSILPTDAACSDKRYMQTENGYPDKHYLSRIGVVTGFKNGCVVVKWANGFTTEVAPYEICRIEVPEGSASSTMSLEENVQELNQKDTHSDEISSIQKEKGLDNFSGAGENLSKHTWGSSSFSLPKAAMGFITNIAMSLFASQSSASLVSSLSCCSGSKDQSDSEILTEDVTESCDIPEPNPGELDTDGKINVQTEKGIDLKKTLDSTLSESSENLDRFRQFDIVNDCSDHHFLSLSKGLASPQVKKSWVKKVHQEWSMLEAELPETIYVRVYEERMGLLRAALIGAPGTPYHNGLFFFDIMLPPQYPYEPPRVHYHSCGMRLNPNLYESGKVCLSLLNTWNGSGTEVWNPGSSSVLQVLLSLQALVLNEKPYFNEAGYDKQLGRAEGERNSVSYNENAFLVTCKSMIHLLRKPPMHFQALVEEHFKQCSQHVLSVCKAYMEGAPLGSTENALENENSNPCSAGFKIMLGKLYPKLMDAFSAIGVDCSQCVGPEI